MSEIKSYKREPTSYSEERSPSIRYNGLRAFDSNATLFATTENSDPREIKRIAKRILDKYHNGVAFVDTQWKGNLELGLKDLFLAKSMFESEHFLYECLSNDIRLDNGFRLTTKGRAITET